MRLTIGDHQSGTACATAQTATHLKSRSSAFLPVEFIHEHRISRAQLLTLDLANLPPLLSQDVLNIIQLTDDKFTLSTDTTATDQPTTLLLTAQYCRPQLNSFDAWAPNAGTALHPGDTDLQDLLQHIRQHRGIWIYWGHGEPDRLRGYGHVDRDTLLAHPPQIPQTATLFITCNTLTADTNNVSVARDWFLGGHTRLLLAACKAVDTDANQAFSDALLAHLPITRPTSFALWFRNALLSLDSDTRAHISDAYRLLGNAQQTVQFLTPGIQPKPAL